MLVLLALLAGLVWWGWQWQHFAPETTPPPQLMPPPVGTPLQPAEPASLPRTAVPSPTNSLPAFPPTPSPAPLPEIAAPTNEPAIAAPESPGPPTNPLEVQIALARRVISPGSIDGVLGPQTRAAVRAFQCAQGLPETGEPDPTTRAALRLDRPPLTTRLITSNDLARLQPLSPTWLGKSQQTALEYETILELVAEQSGASPTLIRRLNPAIRWDAVAPGTTVWVPDAAYPEPTTKAAWVQIRLAARQLQAFDAQTNLLAHFPCSIAARVENRPVGRIEVTAIAPDPNYTFDPARFPDSPEATRLNHKLILPPGPNNPVGTAWISLSLPGYGIHGTPHPEQVGRTESLGCFRLANWNANHLLKLVWIGMPVFVEP